MGLVIVTGASGLVGSDTAEYFLDRGLDVVGVDNDMRGRFFGVEGSTEWRRAGLLGRRGYRHVDGDIRDEALIDRLFREAGSSILLVVHAAAQPSHDWAVREPVVDFTVNANGTLNVLQAARTHCPGAAFITVSTSKVYGDRPNALPLVDAGRRWDLDDGHPLHAGVTEEMPVDQALHSLFGVSKLSGDLLTQEYGRYFGMNTACFRPGCVTGSGQAAVELHGFLSYLVRCAVTRDRYRVFGYDGKQVRCNIRSRDLVRAFGAFFEAPRSGVVYNIGGGRESSCSILEAMAICRELGGEGMQCEFVDQPRIGDHKWWISSNASFQRDYPQWRPTRDARSLIGEMHAEWQARVSGRVRQAEV